MTVNRDSRKWDKKYKSKPFKTIQKKGGAKGLSLDAAL